MGFLGLHDSLLGLTFPGHSSQATKWCLDAPANSLDVTSFFGRREKPHEIHHSPGPSRAQSSHVRHGRHGGHHSPPGHHSHHGHRHHHHHHTGHGGHGHTRGGHSHSRIRRPSHGRLHNLHEAHRHGHSPLSQRGHDVRRRWHSRGHSPRRTWPQPLAEAGFFARGQEHHKHGHDEFGRHTGDTSSTSFEDSNAAGGAAKKKAEIELKIKELDRQIEQQRSSERALSEQEEDQEKEMGDDAVLTPAQEEAALKAREISKQEANVVDKTEQLVKEKLDLLKELKKLEDEEAKGKEPVQPGETITKEIVGPAGEKEVEVVKEEEGGKEEVMEIKQETPEEAEEIQEAGGEVISPPPAEEIECPPCPPLPKSRERPLMISAEDEPPGRAPRLEVDVTESYQPSYQPYAPPNLLFTPPAPVKKMRLSMPEMPQVIQQATAGDDRIEWELPKHVPGPAIGSQPPSLSGALMDSEVTDENEVPQEYDEVPEETVHEALRGGHSFKRPVEEMMPLAALLKPSNGHRRMADLAKFL